MAKLLLQDNTLRRLLPLDTGRAPRSRYHRGGLQGPCLLLLLLLRVVQRWRRRDTAALPACCSRCGSRALQAPKQLCQGCTLVRRKHRLVLLLMVVELMVLLLLVVVLTLLTLLLLLVLLLTLLVLLVLLLLWCLRLPCPAQLHLQCRLQRRLQELQRVDRGLLLLL